MEYWGIRNSLKVKRENQAVIMQGGFLPLKLQVHNLLLEDFSIEFKKTTLNG
jgi:hypothetical protein